MLSVINNSRPLKYFVISIPVTLAGTGAYFYFDRVQKLDHPVAKRALKVLQADKRVVDFCGDNIKPGWFIKRKIDAKEGTVVYNFNVTGGSGKLKTTITADHALHGSLKIFNEELEEHNKKKLENVAGYDVKDFEDNWPIDLEEYDLPDETLYQAMKDATKFAQVKDTKINEEDKLWRIKSLRVAVDDDTRILLLPLPESKRSKKLIDTRYTLETYEDIVNKYTQKHDEYEQLNIGEYKRFEDKTSEEIADDIKHRRRKQFQEMSKIRKIQFGCLFAGVMFYMLIWKRIAPSPVLGSAVYNTALNTIKQSDKVKQTVGNYFQVMSCTGKTYPLLNNCTFDLVVNGSEDQAKFRVKAAITEGKAKDSTSSESKNKKVYAVTDIYMLTKSDLKTYKI